MRSGVVLPDDIVSCPGSSALTNCSDCLIRLKRQTVKPAAPYHARTALRCRDPRSDIPEEVRRANGEWLPEPLSLADLPGSSPRHVLPGQRLISDLLTRDGILTPFPRIDDFIAVILVILIFTREHDRIRALILSA